VTYRSGLVRLAGSSWTTDAGWGCMVRSAQMMLAHAWQRALCGASWSELSRQPENQPCHDLIVRWFTDHPLPWHSFGVHHITQRGVAYGMTPGEWYGPHKVAVVLRDLLAAQMRSCDGFMASAVATDSTVYVDQIHELCADESKVSPSHPLLPADAGLRNVRGPVARSDSLTGWEDAASASSPVATPDSGTETTPSAEPAGSPEPAAMPWRSSLFLQVPLRLGLGARLDVRFWPGLRRLLSLVPQCLGMVGGTPSHSLFFVGITPADKLVYLDPHTTQPTPRFKQGVPPSGKSLSAPASARSIAASSVPKSAAACAAEPAVPVAATKPTGGGPVAAASSCSPSPSTTSSPPVSPKSAPKASKPGLAASDSLPVAPPLRDTARSHTEPISKPEPRTAASSDAQTSAAWVSWLDGWTLEQQPAEQSASDGPHRAAGTLSESALAAPDAPPPPLRAALAARAWDLAQDDWASTAHSRSFHFRSAWLRTTPPTRIDPSLTVGFFCRDAADFADMQRRIADAFHGRDAPFAIEATTPAWMLERAPSPAVAASASAGTAARRSERAVPTYRDAFGLPPLSESAAAPSRRPPDAAAVARSAGGGLASGGLPRADSADLASWVHVQPDVTLDDDSGFLVVNNG
jgi:hypothetical protein